MTKVVNIKYSECDVYIGRANSYYKMAHSIFANPFNIDKSHDRETVLKLYEQYLDEHPELIESAVEDLDGKVLGCWCSPQACHGDILIRRIEQWKKQNQ